MKITLTNAGKRFSREWIFRNLQFDFFQGNKYAITGANGSGKSTLLQIISGALILNEGECNWLMNDKKIEPGNIHSCISFAAPYFELIEEMTAKEFLLFHNTFKSFINNFSAEEILAQVDLSNAADKQTRFFSSGMKQRLKLAQAIFSDTPIILLDEPCTNLDDAGFKLYYNLIENYCNNRLLIISSNDKNEYSFCNNELRLTDYKQVKTPVKI